MRFALGDDVCALRDGVASYLASACPPAVVRAAWDAGGPAGAGDLWAGLAGIGVLGMLAPESAGGLGADEIALAAVLAEAGRAAVPLPLVETAAVAVPVLAAAGDPAGILAGVVSGDVVVSVGDGAGVPAASTAGWFVLDGPTLYERGAVDLEPLTSVDRTRDLARVVPRHSGLALGVDAATVRDRGALGTAAVLLGLGRGMLELTVAYVKQRRQFGVPVGSFQAVKHRLADTLVGLELAAPAVWHAAYGVAHGEPDAPRSVSVAKAMAADAALAAGRAALQCHGAMGYTDEYHLHLWCKRTWCLAGSYGSAAWHRDRVGRAIGV